MEERINRETEAATEPAALVGFLMVLHDCVPPRQKNMCECQKCLRLWAHFTSRSTRLQECSSCFEAESKLHREMENWLISPVR